MIYDILLKHTPQELPRVDGMAVEYHPGKQSGLLSLLQRTASDVLLHRVGVQALQLTAKPSHTCVSCDMISYMIHDMISDKINDILLCPGLCGVTVLLVPYPNNPNPVESFNIKTNINLQGGSLVWYACPLRFFDCTLCPTGGKGSGYSASHKEVSLVYFNTFEPIDLTPDSIMHRAGVPMLYDLASYQACPTSTSAL
jgi:hypothetical protein